MTLWGGRFRESTSGEAWDFTVDDSDRRLLEVDIEGSIAHARMLGDAGIIPADEAHILVTGLESLLDEARSGGFEFMETDEDVHTAVERRLTALVGEVGGKLHTGRSRNDQVATDLRLYLGKAGGERSMQIHGLMEVLVDVAEREAASVIPSYTHLQQAQATTLGNHLLAYAWMLWRDVGRLSDAVLRMNESPLGAAAGAGTSLPLDRESVAEQLGFLAPIPNTLDAVASRDFVAEYVFACAQTMTHLSRLAEELVLWSTTEFRWLQLGDEVTTGSSALPHKKNPDVAELIRGRTASVAADVTAILSLQKGLPLTYNRDLQEDKRIAFHADDTLGGSMAAMTAMLESARFMPHEPVAEVAAIDLAEALVTRGVPFREAHRVVGEVVRGLEEQGRPFSTLTDEDLLAVDGRFVEGDAKSVDVGASVANKKTVESVRKQIEELRARLE